MKLFTKKLPPLHKKTYVIAQLCLAIAATVLIVTGVRSTGLVSFAAWIGACWLHGVSFYMSGMNSMYHYVFGRLK
jgi:hypothetical protein